MKKLLCWALCVMVSMPLIAADTITIELSTKGNNIAFDQDAVQVKFQKSIKLRFVNKAAEHSAIGHNIAILKPGATDEVLKALRDSNYNLESVKHHPGILVMSKTLNPGEEAILEFSPEKASDYPYLCLMPGHSDLLGMKGILHIVP